MCQLLVATRLTRTTLLSVDFHSPLLQQAIERENRRRSTRTNTHVTNLSQMRIQMLLQTGIRRVRHRILALLHPLRRVRHRIPALLHPLHRLTTSLFPLRAAQAMAPEIPTTRTTSHHLSNPTSTPFPRRGTHNLAVAVTRARRASINPCQAAPKSRPSTHPRRLQKSLAVS